MFQYFKLTLFAISLFLLPFHTPTYGFDPSPSAIDCIPSNHIVRRVALDIGSGQIKMQVSDVDTRIGKISTILLTDTATVSLREDLVKSPDGHFSNEIQKKLVDTIIILLKKAEPFHAKESHAVATESFRLAKNGQELALRIKNETGLSVTIISQEEEGILGFISATNARKSNPEKVVSWDFGGGSFQITTKCGDEYVMYKGLGGSVPFKNVVIRLLGKDSLQTHTPNPIHTEGLERTLQFVKENVNAVPIKIMHKILQSDVVVLGIGLHPLWTMPDSAKYDRKRVMKEIERRIGLDDESIMKIDLLDVGNSKAASAMVSNLILTYGLMDALGIDEIEYVGTSGANAVGALLSPKYWKF